MRKTIFKYVFNLSFILFYGIMANAQSLSITDCSNVLILQEDSTLLNSASNDLTMDSVWSNQNNFEIMFIVEVEDSTLVNKVHIELDHLQGGSSLLSSEFDFGSNNANDITPTYYPYSNFININIGEYQIDSLLHYRVRLEDLNGNLSDYYSGIIQK